MKLNPALQSMKSVFQVMKSNPSFTILSAQMKTLKSSPALNILMDQIKEGMLELCSSEPTQSCLSSENYVEIFYYQMMTWFVHEAANVYPVTIHESPINGAIFAFNPSTGKLFLKINIHKANTKQEVAALLRSLPVGEHPKRIFVNVHKGMLDHPPKGFPNIVMKGSELELPFQACLKTENFVNLMKLKANSTDHQHMVNIFSFNVYDDWLKRILSYTAFNRIVLILRAFDVNNEEAKMLLEPNDATTEPDHIWPSLTEDQWVKVEVALKDLILSDYAKKNKNVNTSALTQSEIRDVIFLGTHSL